ncbi:OmpA family protein, partial [Pseudoxanthomonas sp.]|uniref:OmpA family protein n=1 Tax=Pseudoxanthomonas sp. TaxID=1871049 RepID=UPI0025E4F385
VNDQAVGTVDNAVVGTNATCTTNCGTSTPVTAPAVSYSKSVTLPAGQTEVSIGDTLTYTLQVQVSDASTTSLVTLTDTLGTGLTLGTVSPGIFSCGSGNPLVCTLPAATAPGTYTVTYSAIVNDLATGFVRNVVVGTGDDSPTCQGSCQTETIVTEPLPAIISYGKSAALPAGKTQVVAGDVITYTLTTTVAAAPTSGVLTLTDTLGTGLTFGAVTNAGAYTCTSTQPLVCTLPAATAPGVYEVSYTATVNGQATGFVRNAVVGTSDDNPVCAADCDIDTPVAAPTIVVNKSSDPSNGATVQPGQVITYTLSVQVGQSATRAAVTLVDTPDQRLVLGAMPAGCAYNGTTMTCTLPAGTPVGTHVFTYTATVGASASGRVSNVVVASTDDPTGQPPTCQTCSTEHPVNLPEIRLSKSAGAREVKVGDLVRYTLTVENVGTSDLVDGRITDTPPAGFSYVEGSLVAGDADRMATVSGTYPIRIDGVDVPAGETATLVYVMRIGAGVRPGTHVNQAQVRSATDDPVSNVATAEVVLTADALVDDSLLFGTVFNDRDGDGWQDSAALSGVKVQGGFAPGAYIANSTTVDRGAGPQPEPDASSPMLHGIALGAIAGRQSLAEPVDANAVVIRQRLSEASFTDDFVLTTDQGVTVRMDAAGATRVEQSGDAAKGLNAAAPTVERRVSQGEGGYVVDYVIRNAGIDERGIPGVRIASVEGLLIETDQYGRYHLAGVPGGAWERGRNFILKVDPSTLPSGAAFTTDNPLLRRITPGVPVRFDFGVTLPEQVIEGGQEQVELELGEVFFAPGSAEVREKYLPVIEAMAAKVREYQGGDVVIHANGDSESLAFDRANAVKAALLEKLDAGSARGLVVSVRGTVDDPGSLIVGVDEGGALLGTVLFDTDKSTIRPEFDPLLDKVAAALEKMGGGTIAIVGHTDIRASHAYNTALGMRRAKAVYDAIAQRLSQEVRAKVRVEASNDPTAPVGVRK